MIMAVSISIWNEPNKCNHFCLLFMLGNITESNMGWKRCGKKCRSGYNESIQGSNDVTFHKFPLDPNLKQQWIRNIQRDLYPKIGAK